MTTRTMFMSREHVMDPAGDRQLLQRGQVTTIVSFWRYGRPHKSYVVLKTSSVCNCTASYYEPST